MQAVKYLGIQQSNCRYSVGIDSIVVVKTIDWSFVHEQKYVPPAKLWTMFFYILSIIKKQERSGKAYSGNKSAVPL